MPRGRLVDVSIVMRRFTQALFPFALALLGLAPASAMEVILFDGSWEEQGFFRLFSNEYAQRGRQLDVVSDGSVSLLWRSVGEASRFASSASWFWSVGEGVSATDLTIKGGDDRNLALYFVFADRDRAAALEGKSARRILNEESARALIYVWGGAHQTGAVLASPYSPRLRIKVLRSAETGQFRERVDFLRDFRSAFRREPGVLIGIAVLADSDDTNGRIVASVSDLHLE